jgi:hypothetical protein
MLALDSLLAFMASVEKLADWAVDQGGAVPAAAAKGMRSGEAAAPAGSGSGPGPRACRHGGAAADRIQLACA